MPKHVFRSLGLVTTKSRLGLGLGLGLGFGLGLGPLFIHSFHLFFIIIKQFNKKIINIEKIKKRKKQHNVKTYIK